MSRVTHRAATVDLSGILYRARTDSGPSRISMPTNVYDFKLEKTLDEKVLLQEVRAISGKAAKAAVRRSLRFHSTDRTFGTIFGSVITQQTTAHALPDDTYTRQIATAAAGQSFGAFIPQGLDPASWKATATTISAKALSGGKLVVYPPRGESALTPRTISLSATWLCTVQRRARRISTVWRASASACAIQAPYAVCEGVRGPWLRVYDRRAERSFLAPTGKNFAAGMSGGIAYVLDEHTIFTCG